MGGGGEGGKVGHVYGCPEHEGSREVGARDAMHVVLVVHISPSAGVTAYIQPTKALPTLFVIGWDQLHPYTSDLIVWTPAVRRARPSHHSSPRYQHRW